jgi:HK97 family phage portal protein
MSDPAAIPPPSVYNQAISGVIVNERSVLSLMSMAACMRVLGDASSGLAIHVHRQTGNKRTPADPEVDPPDVVIDPCADIDRDQATFNLIASWCLNGNAMYHIIHRDKFGYPDVVEILNPSQMKVTQVKGKRIYKAGSDTSPPIPTKDIIHIPWMSLAGGLVGLNPIEIGAVGFGIPIAMNEYSSRYFAQGMHPTGLLSIEKPIRQDDKERVVGELMTQHGGLAQSHTPIVLDSNAKWTQISVNPQTAQLLEAKTFSRAEIAGFYGVPAHLIGDAGAGNNYGTGLQEMIIGFALFALSGYTRRLDRMDSLLLPPGYYVHRKVSDLFKTNDQMLGEYVASLRMNAIATPNEVRELLGYPPSDEAGADSLWGPINSAHADFMISGGGALSATPAAANQQDNGAQPMPSTALPAGNTQPAPAPRGPNRSRLPLGSGVRANVAETFQKEQQGHGYHGYFESGKMDKPESVSDSPTKTPGDTNTGQEADQPDLTTPWTTGVPPDAGTFAKVVTQNPEGFTIDMTDGTTPTTGFQVAGVTEAIDLKTTDATEAGKQIMAYYKANKAEFDKDPNLRMGGWKDPDTGSYWVEPSETISDAIPAVAMGVIRNQKSVWDNVKAAAGDYDGALVQTYGTGEAGKANPLFEAPSLAEPIHPGDQPNGRYTGMDANSVQGGISEQGKADQLQNIKDLGFTVKQFHDNYMKSVESATPQQIADGLTWYARANAIVENIADASNGKLTTEQAAGIMAAMSPQAPWGSNVAGAQYVAKAIVDDKVVDLPDDIIEKLNKDEGLTLANGQHLSELSSRAQARAIVRMISNEHVLVPKEYGTKLDGTEGRVSLGANSGDNIERAIAIANGAKPGDVLAGMKVRDFFNNIANPNDPRFMTIDGWEASVFIGTGKYTTKTVKGGDNFAKKLLETGGSIADNTRGSYGALVDIAKDVTSELSAQYKVPLPTSAVQAISWGATQSAAHPNVPYLPPPPVERPDSSLFKSGPSALNTPLWGSPDGPSTAKPLSDTEKAAIKDRLASAAAKAAQQAKADKAYLARETKKGQPTVLRPFVSREDALKAAKEQLPNAANLTRLPDRMVYGVDCADGSIALAVLDPETMEWRHRLENDSSLARGMLDLGITAPKDSDIQTALSALADRYDHDNLGLINPPKLLLRGPQAVMRDNGVPIEKAQEIRGYTNPIQPNAIRINALTLSTAPDKDELARQAWTMPMGLAPQISDPQYTVTHEYGHLTEYAHDLYPKGIADEDKAQWLLDNFRDQIPAQESYKASNQLAAGLPANSPRGMSIYGRSDPHEAYAEAFVEHAISGGKSLNKATKLFNAKFHWDKPDKLPAGSNHEVMPPSKGLFNPPSPEPEPEQDAY